MPSILTNKARVHQAKSFFGETLFMAWGRGATHWDTNQGILGVSNELFDDISGQMNVGYTDIDNVVITNTVDDTVYQPDVDYTVNFTTGVITRIGATLDIADSIRVEFYVKPPDPSASAVTLLDEVGRKKILVKYYVVPDEDGTILVDDEKFSISDVPTNHVYLEVPFQPNEAPTESIREYGVLSQVAVGEKVGLPPLTYTTSTELTFHHLTGATAVEVGDTLYVDGLTFEATAVSIISPAHDDSDGYYTVTVSGDAVPTDIDTYGPVYLLDPDIEPGQLYFTPAQAGGGTLHTLRNMPTIIRNNATREIFHVVITF